MDRRYLPQMRLEEIGEEGQRVLSEAHVLVVGCGALGSAVAMYLAGAGTGHLTLADFDTVETSNLHRQVFYTEKEAGVSKAECLKKRIGQLNSDVKVDTWEKLVTKQLLENSGNDFTLIADCADNPATTYMLDTYCRDNSLPLVTAGIRGWEAQTFIYAPGSLSYADIIEPPAHDAELLPCSLTGITGPTAAFAASLQTVEIMKAILGVGGKKSRLITADLLHSRFTVAG